MAPPKRKLPIVPILSTMEMRSCNTSIPGSVMLKAKISCVMIAPASTSRPIVLFASLFIATWVALDIVARIGDRVWVWGDVRCLK